MKKIYLIILSAVISFTSFSQKIINRDPQIESLVSQISADSLKKFDEKLFRLVLVVHSQPQPTLKEVSVLLECGF